MILTFLGHSSFRLECGGLVVYFDPFKAEGRGDADVILVSHGHYDHFDVKSIGGLSNDGTAVICPESVLGEVEGNATALNAGDGLRVGAVRIEARPAYNINKPNHPEGTGLGYIVEAEGKRVYFAGDTDKIPDMSELGVVDAALLPVGGSYTMDWEEAAEAVKVIKPKVAVPMHYGSVVGSLGDAVKFKKRVEAQTETKVTIIPKGESREI